MKSCSTQYQSFLPVILFLIDTFNNNRHPKRKKEKITNILFRKQTVIPKDLLLIIQIKISKFAAIIKSALFECKAAIFTGLSYLTNNCSIHSYVYSKNS